MRGSSCGWGSRSSWCGPSPAYRCISAGSARWVCRSSWVPSPHWVWCSARRTGGICGRIWTYLCFYNWLYYDYDCNKILGKVTKFGEKRIKTLGMANRFMVGGHNVPPPPPLGFIGLNEASSSRREWYQHNWIWLTMSNFDSMPIFWNTVIFKFRLIFATDECRLCREWPFICPFPLTLYLLLTQINRLPQ